MHRICARGGGIQVGDAFIRELHHHSEHNYLVICSKEVMSSLDDVKNFPDFIDIRVIPPCGIFGKILRLLRIQPLMQRLAREFSADVAFTIFGPSFWRPPIPHLCGFAKAQFIYLDSSYFRGLGLIGRLKQHVKRFIQMTSFRLDADAYVTENEEISIALRTLIPDKPVYTVSNSCNPVFDRREDWVEHPLPPFDGTTLLTISADYPHKNLGIIPLTAEYLQKNYPDFKFRFVVTLKPDFFGYTSDDLPEWLLPIGKVGIRECPSLYEQCDFMFLPTLLECFSACYAEAMKMQCPILTSDLSFAKGLCCDAAEYFDPMSPKSVGDSIYRLAHDRKRQAELIEKGNLQSKHFLDAEERTSGYLNILERIV